MSWLAKQIGFDAQEEIPEIAPIDGFHSRVSGRYTSIAGGDSHHGHSHGGGDDHGHSHGGGGHGHGGQEPEEPVTVESACGQGDLAQVMLFYAQGIDLVHRSQPYGGAEACPLMWASLKGHLPVVKFLLDRGADVHFCTQDGQTALHWAVTEGRYDVVDALLRVGARPTDTDVRGYNAFFVAVQGANLGMVALLAEHAPLEANMRDSENHTLMHWAAYRGSIALCQYLHEINGVSIDTVDNLKRTPLIWAAREGHEQVCAYLLSKGARATSQDAEQQTALDYAKERAQRNVEVVLTSNLLEVATRRRAGTLRMIVLDRAALLSSLFGVGYVLTAFVGMLLLPPIVAHMAFGFYFGKNLIFSYLYRMPANHKSLQNMSDFRQIANMSGIPRSFGEAVQSADYLLRRREPANLFALLTFLAVQNVSLLTASIQLSPVYWVSLAVVLVSVWATKHLCMRSVVASGTIQDSAIIRFVRERKFRMLQARIVDQEKHIQLPLRAFYCFERDEIIRNYDSYSVALDAPIGEANLPWFAAFLLSFTALQLTVLCMAWSQTSAQFCETNARSGALWGVVFHALPCAIPPPDDTWWSFFFPSSLNSAGVWMIDYALVTFLFGVIVLGRVMGPLLFGCTRKELLNATVPTADGELVSLMRNGRPIFSEGAGFTNMLFLFTGRFGQRWRGLYSVPAPPTH